MAGQTQRVGERFWSRQAAFGRASRRIAAAAALIAALGGIGAGQGHDAHLGRTGRASFELRLPDNFTIGVVDQSYIVQSGVGSYYYWQDALEVDINGHPVGRGEWGNPFDNARRFDLQAIGAPPSNVVHTEYHDTDSAHEISVLTGRLPSASDDFDYSTRDQRHIIQWNDRAPILYSYTAKAEITLPSGERVPCEIYSYNFGGQGSNVEAVVTLDPGKPQRSFVFVDGQLVYSTSLENTTDGPREYTVYNPEGEQVGSLQRVGEVSSSEDAMSSTYAAYLYGRKLETIKSFGINLSPQKARDPTAPQGRWTTIFIPEGAGAERLADFKEADALIDLLNWGDGNAFVAAATAADLMVRSTHDRYQGNDAPAELGALGLDLPWAVALSQTGGGGPSSLQDAITERTS